MVVKKGDDLIMTACKGSLGLVPDVKLTIWKSGASSSSTSVSLNYVDDRTNKLSLENVEHCMTREEWNFGQTIAHSEGANPSRCGMTGMYVLAL
jgi:hypothetical protein